MLDVLLLALQIITILLLFLFIWWVVHSARGDLLSTVRTADAGPRRAPDWQADGASWQTPGAGQSGAAGEWYGEPPAGAADWAVPAPAPGAPPDTAPAAFDWSPVAAHAPAPIEEATAPGPPPADTAPEGLAGEAPLARAPVSGAPPGARAGAATPCLVVEASPVLQPGTEIPLTGWLGIGRSPGSDLPLADPFVSSTHARVVNRDGAFFVEDLGSKNGTFLDERPIGEARLTPEARLRIGDTVFRFRE